MAIDLADVRLTNQLLSANSRRDKRQSKLVVLESCYSKTSISFHAAQLELCEPRTQERLPACKDRKGEAQDRDQLGING